MKAQELRIRNLLQSKDGKVHYVSNLSLDIDDEYNELIGGTSLGETSNEVLQEERELYWRAIPLTEEWLLKFGFAPYALQGWFQNTISEHLSIHINRSMQVCLYAGEYIDGDGALLESIQYVHQLQNLYFALTGEELTIEEWRC
jgi:hypothetical protein